MRTASQSDRLRHAARLPRARARRVRRRAELRAPRGAPGKGSDGAAAADSDGVADGKAQRFVRRAEGRRATGGASSRARSSMRWSLEASPRTRASRRRAPAAPESGHAARGVRGLLPAGRRRRQRRPARSTTLLRSHPAGDRSPFNLFRCRPTSATRSTSGAASAGSSRRSARRSTRNATRSRALTSSSPATS